MVRIKCSHNIPSLRKMWSPELMWHLKRQPRREAMWGVYGLLIWVSHTTLILKLLLLFFTKGACNIKGYTASPSISSYFSTSLPFLSCHSYHANSWPVKCGGADRDQHRDGQCFWLFSFNLTFMWKILCLASHEFCLCSPSNQSHELGSVIILLSEMRKLRSWEVLKMSQKS